jgi:hypothetical protein
MRTHLSTYAFKILIWYENKIAAMLFQKCGYYKDLPAKVTDKGENSGDVANYAYSLF